MIQRSNHIWLYLDHEKKKTVVIKKAFKRDSNQTFYINRYHVFNKNMTDCLHGMNIKLTLRSWEN